MQFIEHYNSANSKNMEVCFIFGSIMLWIWPKVCLTRLVWVVLCRFVGRLMLIFIAVCSLLPKSMWHCSSFFFFGATAPCNQGDLRLVGGTFPDRGRVEICLYNMWGTICDDVWGTNDALVVCRQLGFSGTSKNLHSYQTGNRLTFKPLWQ